MSARRTAHRAITCALLLSSACADIVYLKTGEQIEGRVISETPQQVTFAVKVSASIIDERVIQKSEIDRVEKVSPESEAFKAISAIHPGVNSLAAGQYDGVISILQAFVKQHPNSLRAVDVQMTINEFLAEKKRVVAGEVKFSGRWLSKAEFEKERVQIGGQLAFDHMQKQNAAGDTIGALNTFSTLEKNYSGATIFPEAVELARQLVGALKPNVERALPNQKAMKATKELGFKEASPTDRVTMMAAYKNEQAQAEAAVAAAISAGRWAPFIAGSEKSLSALLARATRETTRLAALPVDKMKLSVQFTNEAKQKMALADLEGAGLAIKEALGAWPANDLAKRTAKEIDKLKTAPAPAPAAPAAPVPAPPAPKPAPVKPAAALLPAAPQPIVPEKTAPFFATLPGAISIVVGATAVLAGANVFYKMHVRHSAE